MSIRPSPEATLSDADSGLGTSISGEGNARPKGQKEQSFLRRRFSPAWVQKRQDEDKDSSRGALGLVLLHASPQPLVDIVFVHGLRGGSTKTWRKGTDPRTFWPKHWLPMDPELCHASIYSFGYDSDWGSTKASILDVNDFGRALYQEMRLHPMLRQKPNVPPLGPFFFPDWRACKTMHG